MIDLQLQKDIILNAYRVGVFAGLNFVYDYKDKNDGNMPSVSDVEQMIEEKLQNILEMKGPKNGILKKIIQL